MEAHPKSALRLTAAQDLTGKIAITERIRSPITQSLHLRVSFIYRFVKPTVPPLP